MIAAGWKSDLVFIHPTEMACSIPRVPFSTTSWAEKFNITYKTSNL
jgi:hypothetical protein